MLSALCVLVIAGIAFVATQRPLTTVTVTHAVVTPTSTIGTGPGIYAGATAEVISTNLGDDGWSHVFRITIG